MNQEMVEDCLESLDRIFHSEADFQHEFAQQLQDGINPDRLRLERRWTPRQIDDLDEAIYVDIWIRNDGVSVPIELKYKTAEFASELHGEQYDLKSQSAQDVTRFDFIWDIRRLEKLVSEPESDCDHGYALLLTNDHLYWQEPTRKDVVDYEFRVHDGKTLERGGHAWAEETSDGTKGEKRDRTITLDNDYDLNWQDYDASASFDSDPEFRYLLLRVD